MKRRLVNWERKGDRFLSCDCPLVHVVVCGRSIAPLEYAAYCYLEAGCREKYEGVLEKRRESGFDAEEFMEKGDLFREDRPLIAKVYYELAGEKDSTNQI